MRQSAFEKTQYSQRPSWAAVPNKRSSPPAEKVLGMYRRDSAKSSGNGWKIELSKRPGSRIPKEMADRSLLRGDSSLLDHPQVFRALILHKIPELADRHRGDDRTSRFEPRFNIRVLDHQVNLLVEAVDDRLRGVSGRKKTPIA